MTQLTNLSNELFSTGFLFEQFDYSNNDDDYYDEIYIPSNKVLLYFILLFNLFLWLFLLALVRPFREKSVNFASILDLSILFFFVMVFGIKYPIGKLNGGYFDNFSSTLLFLAASLPGTLIMIFYKAMWAMIGLIIKSLPYIRWFLYTSYIVCKSDLKKLS